METATQKFRLMARFIAEGNDYGFNLLLPKLTDINFQTNFHNTALHDCLMYNRDEMARRLISQNADIYQQPILTSALQTFSSMKNMDLIIPEFKICMLNLPPVYASIIHGKKSADQVMQNIFFDQINLSSQLQKNNIMRIAMAYGNIHVFDLMMQSGDKTLCSRLEMDVTPLMWSIINIYEVFNVSGIIQFSIEDILSGILRNPAMEKIAGKMTILEESDFDGIKSIISKYPYLLWDRHNKNYFGNRYTTREATGKTPMAMLMETLIQIEKKSSLNQMIACNAAHEAVGDLATNLIDTCSNQKKLLGLNVFMVESVLGSWIWNKMLQELRLAVGMATHSRLGASKKCEIKFLGNDEMDFIFKELIKSISWDEKMFMVS